MDSAQPDPHEASATATQTTAGAMDAWAVAALDILQTPVVILDAGGTVRYSNKAAERSFGAVPGGPAHDGWHRGRPSLPFGSEAWTLWVYDEAPTSPSGDDQFQRLAESIPNPAWMARADGHIFWFNSRWFDYTGITHREMTGLGWAAVLDPETLPSVTERWSRCIQTAEPFEMVISLRGADGRFRPFLTRIVPLFDDAGRLERWFGSGADISAQEALRTTEERLLRVVDASAKLLQSMSVAQVMADALDVAPGLVPCHAAAIWRENPDGSWTIVASRGLSPEYVERSRGVRGPAVDEDLMLVEDTAGPAAHESRRSFYKSEGIGSLLGVPLRIRGGLSGTLIFYFREARSFSEGEREVARALGNVAAAAMTSAETFEREAATRRKAEAGERRAAFVARAGATLHASLDMDAAVAEVLQLAVAEVADQATFEPLRAGRQMVFSAGTCGDGARAIHIEVRAGATETFLLTFRREPAREPWDADDTRMLEELGRRIGVALENTRLHREVREASERAHLAMEAAELGTWDIDLNTGTLMWSSRTRSIFGIAPDGEVNRAEFYERVHPEDRQRVRESFHRAADPALGNSETVEYRVMLPDGSVRWIVSAGRALFEDDGARRKAIRMIGIVRDNTAARLAEQERQALLDREQEARSTAELLNKVGPLLLSELDRNRLVQKLVEICTRLVGAAEGALSSDFVVWDSLRVADCRVDPSFAYQPPFGNSSYRSLLAIPVTAHTGESFGTLVFAHPGIDYFGQREQQLAEGVAAQAAIALDNARLFEEAMRVQEALHKANVSLRSANTDLEQFAFAAAHDLREPLRMVTSYTQLLERRIGVDLNEQTKWMMQQIVDGAARMADLLQDLLSYTNTATQFEPAGRVELTSVVNTVLQNLAKAVSESGAEVKFESLPVIRGRNGHMIQVFQNLIGNAIKYRQPEVQPVIEISAELSDSVWLVRVKDNGIGIAPQYQTQIFGVFKRLHGREIPGTGIGLAICQRAIERAGGKIWVESTPGEGSTFLFTLPEPPEVETTEPRSEEG